MVPNWNTVPLKSLIKADRGISYGIVQPGSPVSDGVPIVRVRCPSGKPRLFLGRVALDDGTTVVPIAEG
jgi:hypothetical protein